MFLEEKNRNGETAVPPAPGTVQHFIQWLEGQSPFTTYNYACVDCLHARYRRSLEQPYHVPFYVNKTPEQLSDHDKIEIIAFRATNNGKPWNTWASYADALAVAKKMESGELSYI